MSTPVAGDTHDWVIEDLGLMLIGVPSKTDITSAIPRMSVTADERTYFDFGELDTFSQISFHHGRGFFEFSDEAGYSEARNVLTHVPNQVTLGYLPTATQTLGGVPLMIKWFGSELHCVIKGTTPAYNKVYDWGTTATSWTEDTAAGLSTATGASPSSADVSHSMMIVAQGGLGTTGSKRPRHKRLWGKWPFTYEWLPDPYTGATGSRAELVAGSISYTQKAAFGYIASNKSNTADPDTFINDGVSMGAVCNVGGPGTALVADTPGAWVNIKGLIAWGTNSDPKATSAATPGIVPRFWVIKPSGIFSAVSGASVPAMAEEWAQWLGYDLCGDNGKAIAIFGDALYFAGGGLSVKRYNGSVLAEVGLDRYGVVGGPNVLGMETDRHGYISCLTASQDLLFATINRYDADAGYSSIVAYDGSSWHDIFVCTGAFGAHAAINYISYIPPVTSTGLFAHPTLWFNIGPIICYITLPRNTLDPLTGDQLTGYEIVYQPTGYFITSWYEGTALKDLWKNLFKITTEMDNADISGYLSVKTEYQVDDDTAWWTLGTHQYTKEVEWAFPDNYTTPGEPFTSAKKMRFKFTLARDASNTKQTPRFRGYGLKYIAKPDPRYGWTGIAVASNKITRLDGEEEDDRLVTIRRRLYGFRSSRRPIWFDDGISPPARTNQIVNPSFEVEGATSGLAYGWTKLGSPTTSLDSRYKVSGVYSQKVTASVGVGIYSTLGPTCSTGDIIYVSAYIYVASTGSVALILARDSGALMHAETVDYDPTSTTRFKRVSFAYTTIAARTPMIKIQTSTGTPTFYIDCVDMSYNIPNGDDGNYIDGDQPRCYWTGVAHQSTSARKAGYQAYITNLSELTRGLKTPTVTATELPANETDITIQLREVP